MKKFRCSDPREFVIGKTYHITEETLYGDKCIICKVDGFHDEYRLSGNFISDFDSKLGNYKYYPMSTPYVVDRDYRLATRYEQDLLQACVDAGKIVDIEKIPKEKHYVISEKQLLDLYNLGNKDVKSVLERDYNLEFIENG